MSFLASICQLPDQGSYGNWKIVGDCLFDVLCPVLAVMLPNHLKQILLQILDTNPQLFFHLQQQRLIELIRNGKVEEALEFAQEELAPRGEENVIDVALSFHLSIIIFVDYDGPIKFIRCLSTSTS